MPKDLTSRIQDLENEIQDLITLQCRQYSNIEKIKFTPPKPPPKQKSKKKHEKKKHKALKPCEDYNRSQSAPTSPKTRRCLLKPYAQDLLPGSKSITTSLAVQPDTSTYIHNCKSESSDEVLAYTKRVHKNFLTKNRGEENTTSLSQTIVTRPGYACKSTTKIRKTCETTLSLRGLQQQLCEEKARHSDCQTTIERLQAELNSIKARMVSHTKDRDMLTDALQLLRQKYKSAKCARRDADSEVEHLRKLNVDLCRKLDVEMKKNAETVKNIREESAREVEFKVKEQASMIFRHKDEHHRKLKEANEKLARNTQEVHQALNVALQEIETLKMELKDSRRKLQSKDTDIDNLKELLEQEKSKNNHVDDAIDGLKEKIQEMVALEKRSQQEVASLKIKNQQLLDEKLQFEEKMYRKIQDFEKAKKESDMLRNKLNELFNDDSKKYHVIESEMTRFSRVMQEKEAILSREKNKLRGLVKDLSDVVKSHKGRINELIEINQQQEEVLEHQMVILESKDEQLKLAEIETNAVKQKSANLEEQIKILRKSMEAFESVQNDFKPECNCTAKLSDLHTELSNARKSLQDEKDKLLIKEKIIEDQADTINNLKNNIGLKGSELRRNSETVCRLQKQLEVEKQEKQKLLLNIEDMEWHKEHLKRQIENLEIELEENKSSVCPAAKVRLESQKKMLESLERQVSMKQQEYNLRTQVLAKEKDKALNAARFATQKLLDTVSEFQTQTDTQKKVQEILTNMLKEKRSQLMTCRCRPSNKTNPLWKYFQSDELPSLTTINRFPKKIQFPQQLNITSSTCLKPSSQCSCRKPLYTCQSCQRPVSQCICHRLKPDSQYKCLRSGSQCNSLRPDSQNQSQRPDSQCNSLRPGSQYQSQRPGSQCTSTRPASQCTNRRSGSSVCCQKKSSNAQCACSKQSMHLPTPYPSRKASNVSCGSRKQSMECTRNEPTIRSMNIWDTLMRKSRQKDDRPSTSSGKMRS